MSIEETVRRIKGKKLKGGKSELNVPKSEPDVQRVVKNIRGIREEVRDLPPVRSRVPRRSRFTNERAPPIKRFDDIPEFPKRKMTKERRQLLKKLQED